jgi:hypothetical protein
VRPLLNRVGHGGGRVPVPVPVPMSGDGEQKQETTVGSDIDKEIARNRYSKRAVERKS